MFTRYVFKMFTTCSQHALYMFTTCSPNCSRHVHHILTTISPHFHQIILNMFTTFSQHVHNMFTKCLVHNKNEWIFLRNYIVHFSPDFLSKNFISCSFSYLRISCIILEFSVSEFPTLYPFLEKGCPQHSSRERG